MFRAFGVVTPIRRRTERDLTYSVKNYYVYLMTNRSRVVLYAEVTNNLERRVWQHRHGDVEGFTKAYKVDRLVYYEQCGDVSSAIAREKEIKGWRRKKKDDLVETLNPLWIDLGPSLFGSE